MDEDTTEQAVHQEAIRRRLQGNRGMRFVVTWNAAPVGSTNGGEPNVTIRKSILRSNRVRRTRRLKPYQNP